MERVNSPRRYSNDKYTLTQHQSTQIYKVCIDKIERELGSNTIIGGGCNTPLKIMYPDRQKISKETDLLHSTVY